MTLIPLTFKNFVNNKIINTTKIKYKNSDLSTYIYDENIDSKSILNTQDYEDITQSEIGVDSENKIFEIKRFIRNYNIISSDPSISNYAERYFNLKRVLLTNTDNNNLKLYNFRTGYGIERVTQTFLPQSFELQKKNYVKNSLYKAYQKDFSLDFYNNLEFGFCNWNTINFFSQKYNTDTNHTNCIIWPNSKKNTENIYNFVNNGTFNSSFYFNLRKNYNSASNPKPECIFHIPDLISLYIFPVYNSDPIKYRIAFTLGTMTRNKLISITNISMTDTDEQHQNEGVYVSAETDILNNRWYNLSLNHFKTNDQERNIQIYLDSTKIIDKTFNNITSGSFKSSFICLGNKPNYSNPVEDYNHVFYNLFARRFEKDISLGKDNIWNLSVDSIDINNNFNGNINFEKSIIQNSESFHGEIHDIRIYGQTLSPEKILFNSNNTINNIENEVNNYNLQFHVPVHYVPSYTNKLSSFNASQDTVNLRYDNLYNPVLANTCGGLEITCESYLIDFVNHTKPNIVVGGSQASRIYDDSISNSIDSIISSTEDVSKIKKGMLTQSIYNYNFNNVEAKRNLNLDHNLSYRNLLILPNDNGIQKVRFDIIKEFLNGSNYDNNKFNSSKFNSSKPFNISVENLFKDSYYNKSLSLDANFDSENLVFQNFEYDLSEDGDTDEFEIHGGSIAERETFVFNADKSFNVSNIIYHDSRIVDISNINFNTDFRAIDYAKDLYLPTESNPILRNYKQRLDNTGIDSSDLQTNTFTLEYDSSTTINYLKLPIAYSVINKDFDSIFINIFDISSKMYNKSIKKRKFNLIDTNISTSNNNLNLKLSDNGSGALYRNNCLTKVADWNYVGHIFYKEGIASLNRPELFYFGENDFECEFESDFNMYVQEINIPVEAGMFDKSSNKTHDINLRHDESAFNSEESFVYITDINLHDENLNVVARAKLARPAAKKKSDSILFRLKMDY